MEKIVNSKAWQFFPTWMIEMAFAVLIFFGTAILCTGNPVVLYGTAIALTLTFGYVQIGTRLQEAQETLQETHVECFQQMNRYLIAKELTWGAIFFYVGAYPAIPGALLFTLYPTWRKYYRKLRRSSII